jgi:hypothetical protein
MVAEKMKEIGAVVLLDRNSSARSPTPSVRRWALTAATENFLKKTCCVGNAFCYIQRPLREMMRREQFLTDNRSLYDWTTHSNSTQGL